jgi:L-alanine-DL-glutamate epimerase-like enolase superfamily enzyme
MGGGGAPRVRVTIQRRMLRFRAALRTSYGAVAEREILELTIEGADGIPGRGEAAPLQPYDGVSPARAAAALEAYRPIIEAGDALPGGALLDACRAADDLPQGLAAVDMALWDRAGRRAGRPVAQLLSELVLEQVLVNATIGAADRAGAAASAAAARQAGFRCVKLKVGIGDDGGRVAAVRAALGPQVALRLDANGAWSVEQAVAAIEALAPAGLELVEEPVHGLGALRAVRERVAVRIAMDESAAEPGALASGAADAVCLKLARCGGISGLLACASLVRASGAEPYVASTFDGPLGIAAALHAAAALRIEAACGLATLDLFDVVDAHGLAVCDGAIAVPRGPGLL